MIKPGDFLEMRGGKGYEVISGKSADGIRGKLILREVDGDNNYVSQPFDYVLSVGSPIIDVIR